MPAPNPPTPSRPPASIPTWAWWTVVLGCALAYAWARASFTHEYSAVPWRRLLALNAPLPFGHRVLIPWVAGPFVEAGLSAGLVFGVVEAASVAVVLGTTAATLDRWLTPLRAQLGALALGAALVLVYIVPRTWPLQYPWDGPALAVLAVGLWAALHERYPLALAVTVLGAANRETAVLVPAVVAMVHLHRSPTARSRAIAWAQLMVAGYVFVRVCVAMLLSENPGPPLHWTIGRGEYRVFSNLRWLAKARHWPWFAVYLGVLPLAWPIVMRRLPATLHRVARLGAVFFVASLLVANVYEPRAWGEAVYLMSVATLVGILGTASRLDDASQTPRWLQRADRWLLPAVLLGFAAFVLALREWTFLPVAQWPMPR